MQSQLVIAAAKMCITGNSDTEPGREMGKLPWPGSLGHHAVQGGQISVGAEVDGCKVEISVKVQ